ncbi:putative C6 transcription factor [Daldinia decipiens]|uniref:putative C6 transcription factor n=1 Tax=Daldinia decipiens TaxID=326647 RepID=UPI0020C31E0B|nr:putative C6 transcription factor [Daldinia decipiens]KAI1652384.1 putative C6 transcription factor [Daldinia decipiens]
MERRGPTYSVPYGQACMQCFKSKCKCVSRPGGDGCKRCYRLNKQCHSSDSIRRRNTQRNHDSAARIPQLEGKLEGLVSLLQSITKSPDSSDALHKLLNEGVVNSYEQQQNLNTPSLTPSNVVGYNPVPSDNDGSIIPPLSSSCQPEINAPSSTHTFAYEPPANEVDAYFTVFRSQLQKHFAFVYISPDITAQQLRQTRPFLFLLTQNALVKNQSNLDLLLGLFTYVAYSFDPFLNRQGTLSRLMMIALSLAGDLHLNEPLPEDVHMIGPLTPGFSNGCGYLVEDALEGQRAVLGCFVLSSIISSYYAQMDAMRWTPQMEEALSLMGFNKECPTDEAIAFQVRLQIFVQRAQCPSRVHIYYKALHGKLQELKGFLAPEVQNRCKMGIILRHQIVTNIISEILIAQIHYTELCINETIHTPNSQLPLMGAGSNTIGLERLVCLWRSVNAIKSWLDIFFTLSPSELRGLSFLFWAQMARCVVVLYRLSTIEDSAWDCKAVRDHVDLELAGRETGQHLDGNIFVQLAKLLQKFRSWVITKIMLDDTGDAQVWAYTDAAISGSSVAQVQGEAERLVGLGDENWWDEFFVGFK